MSKRLAYILVFSGSFSLMVMELIAGRLIAPYVGSSIYTWTSIIGIFLLGITLGNWLGGRLADAFPRRALFGPIFLLAALSSLVVLFIVPGWKDISKTNLALPTAIALSSLVTFFPSAFFLSFVSPLSIKLVLQRLENTGRTIGNIYGISAAGSILGTFSAGFWLIPSFGTSQIVWAVFVLLAAIGFYFVTISLVRKITLGAFLIVLGYLGWWAQQRFDLCLVESQYYCIRVNELEAGGHKGLSLTLDQLEHSHIYAPEVDPFGDDYIRIFALFVSQRFTPKDNFNVLAIGGGGYVLPRYIVANYPKAEVTVLEIDPKVTEINFAKTNLQPNERLHIIHGDARLNLNRLAGEKFDLVFGDAFNDFMVPFHLTTQEFIEKIKTALNPGGVYAMNMIDVFAEGRFLSSNLLTIHSVFPNTYLFTFRPDWEEATLRHNAVIMGALEPLNEKRWTKAVPLNDPRWKLADPQALANIKHFLTTDDPAIHKLHQKAKGLVLTDNYAPLESMLASLYIKRY